MLRLAPHMPGAGGVGRIGVIVGGGVAIMAAVMLHIQIGVSTGATTRGTEVRAQEVAADVAAAVRTARARQRTSSSVQTQGQHRLHAYAQLDCMSDGACAVSLKEFEFGSALYS